jgi:hypothetical protein
MIRRRIRSFETECSRMHMGMGQCRQRRKAMLAEGRIEHDGSFSFSRLMCTSIGISSRRGRPVDEQEGTEICQREALKVDTLACSEGHLEALSAWETAFRIDFDGYPCLIWARDYWRLHNSGDISTLWVAELLPHFARQNDSLRRDSANGRYIG